MTYNRNLWTFARPTALVTFCSTGPMWLHRSLPSSSFALCGVGAVQALNILLAAVNWFFPVSDSPKWRLFLEIITVLVTDREYDAPVLEMRNWNPIESQSAADGEREAFNNETEGAEFDTSTGAYLYVCNTSDIGLKGERTISREIPVQVIKEINFRLIPLRVPYAVMWYGIYGMLLDVDAFVGAEEIDKCIVWLLLVSVITELIIRSFLGPAAVVKAQKRNNSD